MKKILCLMLVLTLCMGSMPMAQADPERDQRMLMEALIFTMPLMMVKATEIKQTNTVTATPAQAPVNQLIKADRLATAVDRNVVTPNVDTIYTQAMMDLSKGPVILELPRTDRFCMMQFMDAYTSTIAILHCTMLEEGGATFFFVGPFWEGEVPEGMTPIHCNTNMVWMLGRTICEDEADLVHVRAIQDQMDMYTYQAYLDGTQAEKPEGEFVLEENFNPRDFMLSCSMEEYFDMANGLMLLNPADDEEALAAFASIGVGPGLDFDPSIFGVEDVDALWVQTRQQVFARINVNIQRFASENGPWKMYSHPIGIWNTEYDYRAMVSLAALGANPVDVAVYPNTSTDSEGEILTGANKYVIHIPADGFPAMYEHGFWSITAYDATNYLIPNEMDRYAIRSSSPYVLNEDGSLDIYVQQEKPADEKQLANWLPVCEGEFLIFMRIYMPQEDVMRNEWAMPTITKAAQ